MAPCGIFLMLEEVTDGKQRETLLRATAGGVPHATVAYTGDNVAAAVLEDLARSISESIKGKTFTVVDATVNTFTPDGGEQRSDVLLRFDEGGNALIFGMRKRVEEACGQDKLYDMPCSHSTRNICSTPEEADAIIARDVEPLLPRRVRVTAVLTDC